MIKLVELESGAPFTRMGHTGVMTKLQSPLAQIDLQKNQSAGGGGELLAVLHSLISRVPPIDFGHGT
jgi:hypothetical protein